MIVSGISPLRRHPGRVPAGCIRQQEALLPVGLFHLEQGFPVVPSVWVQLTGGEWQFNAQHQALSRQDSLTAATGTTRPDADTLDAPTCWRYWVRFMRSVMRG